MSGFGEVIGNSKDEWEFIKELGRVKKNKTDEIVIVKSKFKNKEYIQLKVWHYDAEKDKEFPLKGNSITCTEEAASEIGEVLRKI